MNHHLSIPEQQESNNERQLAQTHQESLSHLPHVHTEIEALKTALDRFLL